MNGFTKIVDSAPKFAVDRFETKCVIYVAVHTDSKRVMKFLDPLIVRGKTFSEKNDNVCVLSSINTKISI